MLRAEKAKFTEICNTAAINSNVLVLPGASILESRHASAPGSLILGSASVSCKQQWAHLEARVPGAEADELNVLRDEPGGCGQDQVRSLLVV